MDCCRNKTIGWFIGDRSAETFEKFFEKFKHLKAIFYTDDWEVYRKIIPADQHIVGKRSTIKIEQNNSNIRHYLGRMTRKTKVVSKSEEMVHYTLKLCWNINENNFFQFFQHKFLSIFG